MFRLHRGAVASVVVDGPQQAEIFEPMTDRNKGPVSADSHLGDAHSMPSSMPMADQKLQTGADSREMRNSPPKPAAESFAAKTPTNRASAPAAASSVNGPRATVKILRGSGVHVQGQTVHAYSPAVLTIKAGTTVTWRNDDLNMPHLLQGDKSEFTTPMLDPGDSFSYTFREKGTIHYTCLPHPWMKGTIIVN